MAGRGFVPGSSPPQEKVKFTVSVRGYQWSSARHVNETLQEFARVIQRNARRLSFIGENDSIVRLQLAKADGSEPEALDVDATLEDVIICMGSKHLVAIVTPTKSAEPGNGRPEAEKLGPTSPMALSSQQKLKPRKDGANGYALSAPSAAAQEESDSAAVGLNPKVAPFKANCEPPVRGLKITIPSSDPSPAVFHDEREFFGADFGGDRQAGLPQALAPRAATYSGEVLCSNGLPRALMSLMSTPSPAELAHFLVRGSSVQPHRPVGGGAMNSAMHSHCHGGASPIAGFQTFASALLSRLPVMPSSNTNCASTTPNIALLVQFLASQLRAFMPAHGGAQSPPNSATLSPSKASGNEPAPSAMKPAEAGCHGDRAPDKPFSKTFRRGPEGVSPNPAPENVKASGSESQEKDDSSSSANVNTAAAPSSDGPESEHMHGKSELIFLVNRRSKTGVGTHHLKLSDLSTYFHLSVVDAAKKLGVSQTTLKKACRKFGLKRWPGRKVRSLESTIHGLEHTIAVGQGAGMEELTEAYMRSEVSKLQQEMDQLVHGTPAQQRSPVARTADLYKRLYSRGWRSKYHSSYGRFDLDLNLDSRDGEQMLSFAGRKESEEPKQASAVASKVEDGSTVPHDAEKNQVVKPKSSSCKDDSLNQTANGVTDIASKEAVPTAPSTNCTPVPHEDLATRSKSLKTLSPHSEGIELENGKELPIERCPKRPKMEVS